MNLVKVQTAERKRRREEEQRVAAEITPLVRPKGEAGSGSKGFNLQEAMGLEENSALYNDILVRASLFVFFLMVTDIVESVYYIQHELRVQVQVVKLDPKLHFAKQDAEKLGHVYRKVSPLSKRIYSIN